MKKNDLTNRAIGMAIAGVLAGAGLATAKAPSTNDGAKAASTDQTAKDTKAASDKHVCKGMNSCKGKGGCKAGDAGCAGKNSCKGKGGCASADMKHSCKGMNSCKGQGGCKTGDAGCAGKNSCKGKGGCAGSRQEGGLTRFGRYSWGLRRIPRPPTFFCGQPGDQEPETRDPRHGVAKPLGLSRPRHRRRAAHGRTIRTSSRQKPRRRLLRGPLRELHGHRRPPGLGPRPGRRALPGRAARRLAVDRQRRPARPRAPREAEGPGRAHARRTGSRTICAGRGWPGATRTTCCRCL